MRRYVSPTSIMADEEMIYYLMTEDDVLKEIEKIVKEVNEILGLPSTTMVRLLLNYFHWDKDTLTGKIKIIIYSKKKSLLFCLDRYWEDPDKLFRILNFPNPNVSPSINYNPLSPPADTEPDSLLSSKNANFLLCKT